MPTYVYRVVRPAGTAGGAAEETFEVQQSMKDPPLTRHPQTGEPVERVICAPRIGKGAQSNRELGAAGFTKYKKTSDGKYERQAGTGGPRLIDPRAR
jgi:predicted nucleic acid-binding Zn ribbon protein